MVVASKTGFIVCGFITLASAVAVGVSLSQAMLTITVNIPQLGKGTIDINTWSSAFDNCNLPLGLGKYCDEMLNGESLSSLSADANKLQSLFSSALSTPAPGGMGGTSASGGFGTDNSACMWGTFVTYNKIASIAAIAAGAFVILLFMAGANGSIANLCCLRLFVLFPILGCAASQVFMWQILTGSCAGFSLSDINTYGAGIISIAPGASWFIVGAASGLTLLNTCLSCCLIVHAQSDNVTVVFAGTPQQQAAAYEQMSGNDYGVYDQKMQPLVVNAAPTSEPRMENHTNASATAVV